MTLPGSETSVPAYLFSDATSPSPVTDGKHVWFFNACGSVGCYDFAGKQVDEKALLSVNDLGTPGETWSLNSISFAEGRLYYRSMKEVVCIGQK